MIRRKRSRDRESDEINLSPLIDVTFLLLIFFVVTSTFNRDLAVEIERPSAKSAAAAKNKALRVALDASGKVYYEGRSIQPWMLQQRVARDLERAGTEDVLVIVDERADAGQLVQIIDQCRLAGASNVAVAAQSSGGG